MLGRHRAFLRNDLVEEAVSCVNLSAYDLIYTCDLSFLPSILEKKVHAKLVFDAREYYPLQFEDRWIWRWLYYTPKSHFCRHYLSQADCVLTVSQGLADKYQYEFGITCELVYSYPDFNDLEVAVVSPDSIRLVHHGACHPNREIGILLDVVAALDERYSLDLYLVPTDKRYFKEICKRVDSMKSIRIKKPVPFDEIIPTLNDYDVGLFFAPPATFNLKHCLPNKLFEFIQARIMVATGPLPDCSEIVRSNSLGLVSENFVAKDIAKQLSHMSASQISQHKESADAVAHKMSFSSSKLKILGLFEALLEKSS